jgi:uncharacterized protein YeaO (DUF488 family)
MKLSNHLKIKRVYDPSSVDDGTRVLIDRLWPRGLSRQRAAVGLWLKELAPTDALRQWFGHRPSRWNGFRDRYLAELDENGTQVEKLRELAKAGSVTLVYGAKDETHNNAVVLFEYLRTASRASTP